MLLIPLPVAAGGAMPRTFSVPRLIIEIQAAVGCSQLQAPVGNNVISAASDALKREAVSRKMGTFLMRAQQTHPPHGANIEIIPMTYPRATTLLQVTMEALRRYDTDFLRSLSPEHIDTLSHTIWDGMLNRTDLVTRKET
jgi:hypothetical protein